VEPRRFGQTIPASRSQQIPMPLSTASPHVRDPAAWRLAGAASACTLADAEALCRRIAGRHYENFTVATRIVPPRLRQDLANVYAFARWSDDLADEAAAGPPPGAASDETRRADAGLAALAEWRRRLEACFAGRPDHPVFVALAETIRRTGLSIEPFGHLLDAFEEDRRHDLAGTTVRYADREALVGYCRRSADPVGRIVLALEGCRAPDLVAMSDSICTGLQLVNFWQDIRRDRLAGRVYLPRDDMARYGVTEAMLDAPRATAPLRELVATEVAWARACFDRGAPLVDAAPAALRPAIAMFVGGGRAVATAIERAGHDTLVRRPVVGRWTKAALAARAWWGIVWRPRDAPAPVCDRGPHRR
jgi:squalene synthase HpnC